MVTVAHDNIIKYELTASTINTSVLVAINTCRQIGHINFNETSGNKKVVACKITKIVPNQVEGGARCGSDYRTWCSGVTLYDCMVHKATLRGITSDVDIVFHIGGTTNYAQDIVRTKVGVARGPYYGFPGLRGTRPART